MKNNIKNSKKISQKITQNLKKQKKKRKRKKDRKKGKFNVNLKKTSTKQITEKNNFMEFIKLQTSVSLSNIIEIINT